MLCPYQNLIKFLLPNDISIIKIEMCELKTDFILAFSNGFYPILFFFFNSLR